MNLYRDDNKILVVGIFLFFVVFLVFIFAFMSASSIEHETKKETFSQTLNNQIDEQLDYIREKEQGRYLQDEEDCDRRGGVYLIEMCFRKDVFIY